MKKKIVVIVAIAVFFSVLVAALVYNGVILLNNPSVKDYPVRGVDVSHYQGNIDWQTLSRHDNISFAFIKATEGSLYVDEKFDYNYDEAQKTAIRVGAYHFFSFESTGVTQAENFINTVKSCDNMLPPVIDLELYGDFRYNPPAAIVVRGELDALVFALKEHYGVYPIIYATEETYELYLESGYEDCDIWIRSVFRKPRISDGKEWTFWQYTNRERLDGYVGEEKFIDMNVFNGSAEEFENYGKSITAAQ